ncbi:DUF5829 family protein [Streptomyces sp. NPDC058279]|uniref:DUF5829 family protein n=1 Tax=Streptomyces sp. NPDC058279 TaxID=3346418 RepID=UPI0036F02ED3
MPPVGHPRRRRPAEYLADPRGNTEPTGSPGDVGRERYLSDGYGDHLMRDVTSIRLAVTARPRPPRAAAPGRRFGVREVAGRGVVPQGGGTTIRLDAVARDKAGLRRVELSLNSPSRTVTRSASVTRPLLSARSRAVWTFAGAA